MPALPRSGSAGSSAPCRVYQELGLEETRFLGYETIETKSCDQSAWWWTAFPRSAPSKAGRSRFC